MRPNALRSALNNGRPTFGTAMESFSASVVEILGLTGVLDYVEFNSEDAQFDLAGLDHFCRAAELRNLAPTRALTG